jgi:hypothetical protein
VVADQIARYDAALAKSVAATGRQVLAGRLRDLASEAGCSIDIMGFGEGNVEGLVGLVLKDCLAECCYDATPKQIADNIRRKFGVE